MQNKQPDIQHWLDIATACYATGQWPQVIEAYKKVLQADENHLEALINISDCYLQMEMPEAAESFAYRAYELYNHIEDMVIVNNSCVLKRNGSRNFEC